MGIEYLPTDLPRYVKTTARTALANSVVADGHVLLFSEDGETLTAKKPDGSFAEIGGGSGGVEFYKCTELVPATEGTPATWNGYKATMSDEGGYVFADTATTGLSYADGLTPQVGTIYSQDAKVKVAQILEAGTAIPQDGLVFYMPFDGSTDARVGTVAPVSSNYAGNITYETSAGIKYANVSNMLYKAKIGGTEGITGDYTLILYVKINDGSPKGSFISYKAPDDYYSTGVGFSYGDSGISPGQFSPGVGKFHFWCQRMVASAPATSKYTWDNETKTNKTSSSTTWKIGYVYIGGNTAMPKLAGGIFDVAVYDRLLTDAEVEALYQRVIPLQA